jgi:hypothetical protein
MVSVFPFTVRSTMTIVSEISLTTPLILTLVSFGGFGATALECSALAGAVEVPSAAKDQTLKIKTKNATNTIRCFILSSLLIVYLLSDLPPELVPHLKLEFCHFLFLNAGTPLVL